MYCLYYGENNSFMQINQCSAILKWKETISLKRRYRRRIVDYLFAWNDTEHENRRSWQKEKRKTELKVVLEVSQEVKSREWERMAGDRDRWRRLTDYVSWQPPRNGPTDQRGIRRQKWTSVLSVFISSATASSRWKRFSCCRWTLRDNVLKTIDTTSTVIADYVN